MRTVLRRLWIKIWGIRLYHTATRSEDGCSWVVVTSRHPYSITWMCTRGEGAVLNYHFVATRRNKVIEDHKWSTLSTDSNALYNKCRELYQHATTLDWDTVLRAA